jgi:hypothetical protein
MHKNLMTGIAVLLATSVPAWAEVHDLREGSFRTEAVVLVEATPAQAYRQLVRLPEWWDPAHTWSGKQANLTLKAQAGGCFCEKLGSGGSVEHARVVFAQPGKVLRMVGAFGPLQEMPVSAVLTFTLAPDGPGTRISMTYRVAGALSMDSAKLAPLVDQVLTSQIHRLRDRINRPAR